MRLRAATLIVCGVDVAAWTFVVAATVMSGSDAATKGLDQTAGLAATVLFLITAAPALALALLDRAPTTALVLAIAFPATLAAAFAVTVIAFA